MFFNFAYGLWILMGCSGDCSACLVNNDIIFHFQTIASFRRNWETEHFKFLNLCTWRWIVTVFFQYMDGYLHIVQGTPHKWIHSCSRNEDPPLSPIPNSFYIWGLNRSFSSFLREVSSKVIGKELCFMTATLNLYHLWETIRHIVAYHNLIDNAILKVMKMQT